MKEKNNYSSYYWLIAILSLTIFKNVNGGPVPLPRMIYAENLLDERENFLFLQRLNQIDALKREMVEKANELAKAELEILVEKVRGERMNRDEYSGEEAEMLPVPSAIVQHNPVHPGGKRTSSSSYMALCHFKICNMGRKRQSQ